LILTSPAHELVFQQQRVAGQIANNKGNRCRRGFILLGGTESLPWKFLKIKMPNPAF
jgi:hypothetical protein